MYPGCRRFPCGSAPRTIRHKSLPYPSLCFLGHRDVNLGSAGVSSAVCTASSTLMSWRRPILEIVGRPISDHLAQRTAARQQKITGNSESLFALPPTAAMRLSSAGCERADRKHRHAFFLLPRLQRCPSACHVSHCLADHSSLLRPNSPGAGQGLAVPAYQDRRIAGVGVVGATDNH